MLTQCSWVEQIDAGDLDRRRAARRTAALCSEHSSASGAPNTSQRTRLSKTFHPLELYKFHSGKIQWQLCAENAEPENARLENDGRKCRAGKCIHNLLCTKFAAEFCPKFTEFVSKLQFFAPLTFSTHNAADLQLKHSTLLTAK